MSKGQAKHHSIMETITNTAVGFVVSWMAWYPVAWFLEIPVHHGQAVQITMIFTVLSLLRGYVLRRLWNWIHVGTNGRK